MFFTSHLQGDGSLSIIWLAAHSAKSLKKKEMMGCDLDGACTEILDGSFALRLSAFLVLGIHKIHNKQTAFLLHDCSITTERSTFGKKKKEKQQVELDLTQQDILEVDDDQLMETLSLSAQTLPEINRGSDIDQPMVTMEFDDFSMDEDVQDESIEVARRASLDDNVQPFALQDNSILPVPEVVENELRSEELAYSEQLSQRESLPDLLLEPSIMFPSMNSEISVKLNKTVPRKRKRKPVTPASIGMRKYFDTVIETEIELDLRRERQIFNPLEEFDPADFASQYALQSFHNQIQEESPLGSEEMLQSHPEDNFPSLEMPSIQQELEPDVEMQVKQLQVPQITAEQPEPVEMDNFDFEVQNEPVQQRIEWRIDDSFFGKTKNYTKRQAAAAFVDLISRDFDLNQDEFYGDITVG